MLKLRDAPDFQKKVPLVRVEDRVYATWQAAIEGQDQTVTVLVDVEGVAGDGVSTARVSSALKTHQELIEQLANAAYKPGDETVFVTRDQMIRRINDAIRAAP